MKIMKGKSEKKKRIEAHHEEIEDEDVKRQSRQQK